MEKIRNRFGSKGLFSYGGDYFYYMEKIFDTAALNLLWLLFCLPVITVGASTAALYDTVHKQGVQDKGYVVKVFFRSFGRNFKPSCGLWGIFAAAAIIFQLNLGIVSAKMDGDGAVFLLLLYSMCLLFAIGTQLYAFPALSRFSMPAGWILKVSIYMCLRHLPRTILLVLVTAVSVMLVWWCFPLVLLLPAPIHRIYHCLIEPVLAEHTPQSKKIHSYSVE